MINKKEILKLIEESEARVEESRRKIEKLDKELEVMGF